MISGGLKLQIVIPDPALHSTLLFLPIATFKQQKQKCVRASAAQVCCLVHQSKSTDEGDLTEHPRPHVAAAEESARFLLHLSYRSSSLRQRNRMVIHWPTAVISKRIVGQNHGKEWNIFFILHVCAQSLFFEEWWGGGFWLVGLFVWGFKIMY